MVNYGFIIALIMFVISCSAKEQQVINPYFEEHSYAECVDVDSVMEYLEQPIKRIVVHCTATPEGYDYTPEQAQRDWNKRGFNGIPGYNFMVRPDGALHLFRPLNTDNVISSHEIAYGARGYNATSVHISYVGGVVRRDGNYIPTDTRTFEQVKTMTEVIDYLLSIYPDISVIGHRDLNPHKACPSFDVKELYAFEEQLLQ